MTGKTENEGVNMRRHNAQALRAEHNVKRTKKKVVNRRRQITIEDLNKITKEIEITGNPRKK